VGIATGHGCVRRDARTARGDLVTPLKTLTVIGNRPQFIKAAAVSPRLRERGQELLVHTGQHFDDELSAVFFAELGIPAPDVQLAISGGSNTSQTARMLAALEPVIADAAPDCVLVYGDTNSTLAGALAAVQQGVPVAHVEAGMRSFDRAMPEEVNRVLTDHLSTLLLCSSEVAVANLSAEGIGLAAVVEVVGDVMVDVALEVQPRARERVDLAAAHGVEARICWRPRIVPATSTTLLVWPRWSSCCSGSIGRSYCRCTRAPSRDCNPRGCLSGWRRADRCT
jgi:UDP-N-acetylglucosamine 2-epimerase